MSIKRNELYIPHQAIVFAQQDNICDFSLDKVGYAYQNRESNIGHEDALWELENHPTNGCDLLCKGCSYGSRHNEQCLTYEQVCRLVQENSKYDLKSVFFSGGGDPLHWNCWERFLNSVPKRFKYGISTNLYNFSNIKKSYSEIDFYQIHVVGFDRSECIRNTSKDVFELLDSNLKYLLKHRRSDQNVTLKILINKENYRRIPFYLDYVMTMDANSIILKYQQDFLHNRELARQEIVEEIRNTVYNHVIVGQYDYLIDNLDDSIFYVFPEPRECFFAKSGLYKLVDSKGRTFPCIAANAYGDSAVLKNNSLDIYTCMMKKKMCPLKACRHYRFSQYINQVLEGNVEIENKEYGDNGYLL